MRFCLLLCFSLLLHCNDACKNRGGRRSHESAYRILFTLVHPSLECFNLRISACVKEGNKRDRIRSRKEAEAEKSSVSWKSCFLPASDLGHLWGPGKPSRLTRADEEAQGIGDGHFCTSVLHLHLVLVEIKSASTPWGFFFLFYFFLAFLIKNIFNKDPACIYCRRPMWKAVLKLLGCSQEGAVLTLFCGVVKLGGKASQASPQGFTQTVCPKSVADVLQGRTKRWYLLGLRVVWALTHHGCAWSWWLNPFRVIALLHETFCLEIKISANTFCVSSLGYQDCLSDKKKDFLDVYHHVKRLLLKDAVLILWHFLTTIFGLKSD